MRVSCLTNADIYDFEIPETGRKFWKLQAHRKLPVMSPAQAELRGHGIDRLEKRGSG